MEQPSELAKFAVQFCITEAQLKSLMAVYTSADLFTCLDLLKVKSFRSKFRESLANQLRLWLNDPTSKVKPLTYEQLKAATPKWPVTYIIPR